MGALWRRLKALWSLALEERTRVGCAQTWALTDALSLTRRGRSGEQGGGRKVPREAGLPIFKTGLLEGIHKALPMAWLTDRCHDGKGQALPMALLMNLRPQKKPVSLQKRKGLRP